MKCKYKKFLKAAYINYEEDYCSNAMLRPIVQPVYLTQWKIAGNSEVHGDELWYCGEYNATDGKYHILVQPQGGSIADIALGEPLRKVNDVADTIEFPSDTDGKALVTRKINSLRIGGCKIVSDITIDDSKKRMVIKSPKAKPAASENDVANILCSKFNTVSINTLYSCNTGVVIDTNGLISFYTPDYNTATDINNFKKAYSNIIVSYERPNPIPELVDAPQIEEAESYTCVTIPGSKALSWSSFETE